MKKKSLIHKSGEVRELTAGDIQAMQSIEKVLPTELCHIISKRKVGQRGAQKRPIKIPVTLRYSPEVVTYFRSTGKGWQQRMDQALKEWISEHQNVALNP